MRELALSILDIAENSIKAGAAKIKIILIGNEKTLTVRITDNGRGIPPRLLRKVKDPFLTTDKTKNIGLGIPLFNMAAVQTGGNLRISSRHISQHPIYHGTVLSAVFNKNHIDFKPIGDIASTLSAILQCGEKTDLIYEHTYNNRISKLDTLKMRALLEDVPLNSFEVLRWTRGFIRESEDALYE